MKGRVGVFMNDVVKIMNVPFDTSGMNGAVKK